VRIKDAALVAAARLSHRYISDRFLPDKAIDLMDEAAARLRTEIDSLPAELDEVSRKVMQLEIEREALRKETDQGSRARLETLEQELVEKTRELNTLKAQWESEKNSVGRLRKLRQQIEEVKHKIEQAERAYDLNRLAELRAEVRLVQARPPARDLGILREREHGRHVTLLERPQDDPRAMERHPPTIRQGVVTPRYCLGH